MNIALDGMPLSSQLTGVGHYTLELAKNLALVSPADSFALVSPQPPAPAAFEALQSQSPPNLSYIDVAPVFLHRHWWSLGLQRYLSRHSFDLFHGTNYEVPLWSRQPTVVTIHDLSLLLHSDFHKRRLVRRARWRLPLMVRSATRIITPSTSVKAEVCEKFGVAVEKVVVTPEAPRPSFKRREDAGVTELRQRLGIENDFILFVGTIEPRKNLRRLLDAFEQLVRTTSLTLKLVIAGGQGWLMDDFAALIEQKQLNSRICLAGYLQDEDLRALYSTCAAFVYPSLYEGFGLPPLEAMACGAPVITSRIPSLMETVGDAARLVDPLDVADLAQAMIEFAGNKSMRAQYADRGHTHVTRYSWQQTALKTLAVYRSIV